jgi:hypothetical protein
MDILPREIIVSVLNYLHLPDLLCMIVSKNFLTIIKTEQWQHITIKLTILSNIEYVIDNYSFVNYELKNPDVTDSIVSRIKNCRSFKLLNDEWGTNKLTDKCFTHLQKCHTVILPSAASHHTIILPNVGVASPMYLTNAITGRGIKLLSNCDTIKISPCYLTDEDLCALKNCKNIDLTCCYGFTSSGLEIFENFHALRIGNLDYDYLSMFAPDKPRSIEFCGCVTLTPNMRKKLIDTGVLFIERGCEMHTVD